MSEQHSDYRVERSGTPRLRVPGSLGGWGQCFRLGQCVRLKCHSRKSNRNNGDLYESATLFLLHASWILQSLKQSDPEANMFCPDVEVKTPGHDSVTSSFRATGCGPRAFRVMSCEAPCLKFVSNCGEINRTTAPVLTARDRQCGDLKFEKNI